MIPLLVLVGPTAVGKSAAAMEIARLYNGEIVTADSAQVYRYMDIGTAKPSPEEQNQIKHYLIDIRNPDQEFNVYDYQHLADQAIRDIHDQGRLPVLAGGTGLYVRSVTDRYVFSRAGKDAFVRKQLRSLAETGGTGRLHNELQKLDPESARIIDPNDMRRIIRALEVYYTGGGILSGQRELTMKERPLYCLLIIGLNMPRGELYRRIEKRVDNMMERGWLDEVKWLLGRYPPESRGLEVLGYRQLVNHLKGNITLNHAVESIKKETRNLAKRQLTWFRRETRVHWLEVNPQNISETVREICKILEGKDAFGREYNF